MDIRKYKPSDLAAVIKLFHDTVHRINIRDYSQEQISVWAPETVDTAAWGRSLTEHHTLIALEGDKVIGFGDIDRNGYLDRLYVHHEYQGQGVASALCRKLEAAVQTAEIITHASITAKPFFEKRGYKTEREQSVVRNGVELTNYVMILHKFDYIATSR